MPFVEHAIDTGSSRTTGTDLDAEGYARNEIDPGERVEMLSGLSMVLPGSRPGELLTQRAGLAGREWQTLVERIDQATPSFGPSAPAALSTRSEFMSSGGAGEGRPTARQVRRSRSLVGADAALDRRSDPAPSSHDRPRVEAAGVGDEYLGGPHRGGAHVAQVRCAGGQSPLALIDSGNPASMTEWAR